MTTNSLSATVTTSPSFGIGQFKRPVNRRGHITTKTKSRQVCYKLLLLNILKTYR